LLLPMVETAAQLAESRALLTKSAAEVGLDRLPPLGSMIETPAAAENATSIAALSDFLSIGTNDLTASTLGADRFSSNSARTHDPRVLRCIAESVAAAHDAGIPIEVCGEAASDPTVLPLLVGLGIDEVSVGAARVGVVREWIRELSGAHAAAVAHAALTMETAEDVEAALDQLRVDHPLVR
jgi:phosphoenolpyruvate-protein kinase (PTS system EI component)